MNSEKSLPDVNLRIPVCVVMGSEQKGVQPYISKAADERFSIPMSGKFDSFNVSVAAGIILYEAMTQRK
jgi:23S rRNA (guanosine2251-2'-O)-methyltransferase